MRDRSARTSCFSIDAVLVTATRNELAVLLARNSSERERWSLPWRSPQGGETFEIAASRSAQEALGEAPNWMEQIGAFADGKRHPSEADVSRLKMPVLFIAGEEDVLIPPAVLDLAAAAIPGARVQRLAEAGHSVYWEQPEVFNRAVLGFIRKH